MNNNFIESVKNYTEAGKVIEDSSSQIEKYLRETFIDISYDYSLITAKWPPNCSRNESVDLYVPFMPIPSKYHVELKTEICRECSNTVIHELTLIYIDGIKINFKFKGISANPVFGKKQESLKLTIRSRILIVKELDIKIVVNDSLEFQFIKVVEDRCIKRIIKNDLESDVLLPNFNEDAEEKYYKDEIVKDLIDRGHLPKFDEIINNALECDISENEMLVVKILNNNLVERECFWKEYDKVILCFDVYLDYSTIEIGLKDKTDKKFGHQKCIFKEGYYKLKGEYYLKGILEDILTN